MNESTIGNEVSQEDLMRSGQLWSLYYDTEKHHCIGIIELSHSILNNKESIDFDKKMPLAYKNLDKIPFDNEEAYQNILVDLLVISACPNIYLFLEALHEGKDQTIIDFHLNAYENIQKAIGEYKKDPEANIYSTLDRVNQTFTWTSNSKGHLINQYGQKVVRFIDPNLAKWVSLVGSQFSLMFQFVFARTLKNSGFGGPMLSLGEEDCTMSFFGDTEKAISYQPYLEMKKLLPELQWDIRQNLMNMYMVSE